MWRMRQNASKNHVSVAAAALLRQARWSFMMNTDCTSTKLLMIHAGAFWPAPTEWAQCAKGAGSDHTHANGTAAAAEVKT